jgi:hypothetical protein
MRQRPSREERICGWIAWAAAAALVVFFLVLLSPRKAHADPVIFDCQQIALAMSLVADFRDTGADLEKMVALAMKQNEELALPYQEVLEREIRRVWKEAKPKRNAVASVYRRCRAQLGDMGRAS